MDRSKRILLGITGGIAAYKIPLLVRLLKKRGAEVKVVLTEHAKGLVGEEALRTVSGFPVYQDSTSVYDMDHIRLAEWADWFCICPASANTIAKIAHGIGDNLLSTLALSIKENKLIVAPAMNTTMWENQATQSNLQLLRIRGVHVLPVGEGLLACETSGAGRMLEVEELADYILSIDHRIELLKGKKILISSGPTEEALDPVRVLTNKSSGKMGAALARAALALGAEVTIVSGPSSTALPSGSKVHHVHSALEMKTALDKEFENCDICIMAAAVSDYRPVNYSQDKMPRNENEELVLRLVPNPDIVAGLGSRKENRFLVGFALETGDLERAKEKMVRKNCDMMVYNRADEALGTQNTRITVLFRDGTIEESKPMDKGNAAYHILMRIAERLGLSHE